MPTGRVIRHKNITRDMVRAQPSTVFVFGDNMARKGFGDQAKAMRGAPNSVGIPTKWAPDTKPSSYFSDDDLKHREVRAAIDAAFDKMELLRSQGHDIVIPEDGIGTGLADLPRRAPKLYQYIERRLNGLG